MLGWISAQFCVYVVEGERSADWRANITDALLSHWHLYTLTWVHLPYTHTAWWLWQQQITLLKLGGWFWDALLGGGNHTPRGGGCPFPEGTFCACRNGLLLLWHVLQWRIWGVEQKPSGNWTAAFFILKAFKKKLLPVTVQPLKQELHSACVYSRGCSAIWKVCLPFSFQMQGSPFLCGS